MPFVPVGRRSALLAVTIDLGHRRGLRHALIVAAELPVVRRERRARRAQPARRARCWQRSGGAATCSIAARPSRRHSRRSRSRSLQSCCSSSCSLPLAPHGAERDLLFCCRTTHECRALARSSLADRAHASRRRSRRSREGGQLRAERAAGLLLGVRAHAAESARPEGARKQQMSIW